MALGEELGFVVGSEVVRVCVAVVVRGGIPVAVIVMVRLCPRMVLMRGS